MKFYISKSILPLNLLKNFVLRKWIKDIEENPAFRIVNIDELVPLTNINFAPDIIAEYNDYLFVIEMLDNDISLEKLFILAVFLLAFKAKYEKVSDKKVIIVILSKKELSEEQNQVLRTVEEIFDMKGEIETFAIDEYIENHFSNFLEHKVWYKYVAYFERAKEKGWI